MGDMHARREAARERCGDVQDLLVERGGRIIRVTGIDSRHEDRRRVPGSRLAEQQRMGA